MSNQPPPGHWGPSDQPPRRPFAAARRRRRVRLLALAAIVVIVAAAAGIAVWQWTGRDTTGSDGANSKEAALARLDVGRYDVKPRDFTGPMTIEEARSLEAFNLAQGIVSPPDVIPTLTYVVGRPLPEPAMAATALSGTGTPVVQPVLEKYGMVTSFLIQGYPIAPSEAAGRSPGSLMIVALTSFGGAEQAEKAAAEMDEVDFAVNPDNVALPIPGHPDAHAHYRPGFASLAATMSKRNLVVSVFVVDKSLGTPPQFAAVIGRVLDAQVPALEAVVPHPEGTLTTVPRDPDHMLSRLLLDGKPPPVGLNLIGVGGNAVVDCASAELIRSNAFGIAGVDRCAAALGSGVLRTRDDESATTLTRQEFESDRNDIERELPAPQGIPDAHCYEQKEAVWKDDSHLRFACRLAYGRYVATVLSGDERDIGQRAAAQYALLANNE